MQDHGAWITFGDSPSRNLPKCVGTGPLEHIHSKLSLSLEAGIGTAQRQTALRVLIEGDERHNDSSALLGPFPRGKRPFQRPLSVQSVRVGCDPP